MKSDFNLRINPDFLKILKQKAKESNQDIDSFVHSIIGQYIKNEKMFDSSQSSSSEQNNQTREIKT